MEKGLESHHWNIRERNIAAKSFLLSEVPKGR